jgi:uncharacterized protein YhdP
VKRAYRLLINGLFGTVFGLGIVVVVVVLRLLAGPVDLEFLKSYVRHDFDTAGGRINVDCDTITAEWGGLGSPMRLVLHGLHAVDHQGRVMAAAPSVALTFDPRSVFEGSLAPTAITVERPVFDIELSRDGMLARIFSDAEGTGSQGEVLQLLVEQLLAEPNGHQILGELNTVLIEQARVTVRDVANVVVWTAPSAKAMLKRDATGVRIVADARFDGAGGPLKIGLTGVYARDRSRISLEATVDGLKPPLFAEMSPALAALKGIDIAFSGRVRVDAAGSGEIREVAVDLSGQNGSLTLPGILPAAHQVRSVQARASLDATARTARIDRFDVELGQGMLSLSGDGVERDERLAFTGRADLKEVPVDRLGSYWPVEFAPGGRRWALDNVGGGTTDVHADFSFSAPTGKMDAMVVDRLVTTLDYRGLEVQYMPEMPTLVDVSGTARYENGSMHFDIATAHGAGMRVADASIDLSGLDGPDQVATLRMPISGPASSVIELLSRPRLGLRKDMLYDPKRVGGEASIELTLRFPLIDALALSALEIKADATVTRFSLRDALGDADFTDAKGRVVYGNSELNVTAQGKLDGNAVDVAWREMFAEKAPFVRRYELKGTVGSASLAKANLPAIEPYVVGPIGVNLSYQVAANGTGEVAGKFDLKNARLDVPPLGWSKEAGLDGHAVLNFRLAAGGKLTSIDFDSSAGGLATEGRARFAADNVLQQVTVQRFTLGRTDAALEWNRVPDGMNIAVRGRALELGRVLQAVRVREAEPAARTAGGRAGPSQRVGLTIRLEELLAQRGTLGSLNGKLEIVGDRIASADLSLGGGQGSTLKIAPAAGGRSVALYVADFGALLKSAGWLDGMANGWLHFQGRFSDTANASQLLGDLRMGQYRLETSTPRAGIGNLNSLIDGLNRAGNGLQTFDLLEAAISKNGDRIDIKNGRTHGRSIGLTAQGVLDLGSDTLKLGGIVVPAFAINNMLSNVPLLGPLLTGGKDGGVFAVSYQVTGKLDDLKTSINMMTAVAPGALRQMFTTPVDSAPAAPPIIQAPRTMP